MQTQKYPDAQPVGGGADVAGETFAYGFDAMGRPNSMTSGGGATNWISGITYNAAGQPTLITAGNSSVAGETREYNLLGQLTRIVAGSYDFRYNFSATANDGRVTSQSSYLSGTLQETVSYGYDSLNRLASASGSGWSATYGYDGFTNLLTVTPSGAGPSAMNVAVSSSTNRVTGWTYDANGNVTAKPGFSGSYDVENRLAWGSGPGGEEVYGYGADNRRVYQSKLVNAGTGAVQELVTWWQGGKRAGRYELVWSGGGSTLAFRTMETNVWFGGKPLRLGAETNVVADRLGSVRRGSGKDFFPYGQENPATTAGEREKYATYMHDGRTDLAYADQRYYATGAGRFMTADPAGDGLNWYAYTGGDPVNGSDPRGLASLMMYDASIGGGGGMGALMFGSSSFLMTESGLLYVGGGMQDVLPSPNIASGEALYNANVQSVQLANALNSQAAGAGGLTLAEYNFLSTTVFPLGQVAFNPNGSIPLSSLPGIYLDSTGLSFPNISLEGSLVTSSVTYDLTSVQAAPIPMLRPGQAAIVMDPPGSANARVWDINIGGCGVNYLCGGLSFTFATDGRFCFGPMVGVGTPGFLLSGGIIPGNADHTFATLDGLGWAGSGIPQVSHLGLGPQVAGNFSGSTTQFGPSFGTSGYNLMVGYNRCGGGR